MFDSHEQVRMTNQGESVNQSQSTQEVSQMTPGSTKKGNMTHWLVNLDTGPGLTFMSQLDSGLDMSDPSFIRIHPVCTIGQTPLFYEMILA